MLVILRGNPLLPRLRLKLKAACSGQQLERGSCSRAIIVRPTVKDAVPVLLLQQNEVDIIALPYLFLQPQTDIRPKRVTDAHHRLRGSLKPCQDS